MGAHTVISILAIFIALLVAFSIGYWKLVFIHFLCALGLWFYSTTFKRQFFIGNFIIASFTALVPLIVGVYELILDAKAYIPVDDTINIALIWKWVLGISFFAFMTTLLREIIKDIEDYEGDEEFGCQTMPIVMGIPITKGIATVFALGTMGCLGYLQTLQYHIKDFPGLYYFAFGLQLPLAILIYMMITSRTKKAYHRAGNMAKLIMLLGVCYLSVFSYFVFHP